VKRILLIVLVLATAGMFMSLSAQEGAVAPDCCCGGETEGCTEDCDTCDECDCAEDCGSQADCGCGGETDGCTDDCDSCDECVGTDGCGSDDEDDCGGGCGGHTGGGCH